MENQVTVLGEIDADLVGDLTSRRGLFTGTATKLGGLATAPVILAAAAGAAYSAGALPGKIADVLNFALTLEYLEDEFYRTGLRSGVVPGQYHRVFAQISKHEAAHVRFLKGALGAQAVAKPQFDFTAGGKYADVFSNFATFATLSQTFEDLGVGAYKGQAGNLMGNGAILTAALKIHSVEARHAAEVRRINGHRPWDGAFDQAHTKAVVLAAAKPFIVG